MTKKHKAQHILFNNRALLGQHCGIKFLAAELGDASMQGIHLLKPTETELDDALETAQRDLFDTIWVHDTKRTFRNIA